MDENEKLEQELKALKAKADALVGLDENGQRIDGAKPFTAEAEKEHDALVAQALEIKRKMKANDKINSLDTPEQGHRHDGTSPKAKGPFEAAFGGINITELNAGDYAGNRVQKQGRLQAMAERVRMHAEVGDISLDEAYAQEQLRRKAYRAWLRGGTGALLRFKAENEMKDYPFNIGSEGMRAAMNTGTDAEGGYLVPDSVTGQIIYQLKWFGGIRQAVPGRTRATSRDVPYPTINESTARGIRVTENQMAATRDMATGQRVVKADRWSSDIVQVSNTLLRDDAYDLEGDLFGLLSNRIARAHNTAWSIGMEENPSSRGNLVAVAKSARGYVALNDTEANGGLPVGVKAANSAGLVTTMGFDQVVDLVHSVDVAYRPGSAFMANDSSVAVLAKVKDSDGRPLFQFSARDGEPDRFYGRPLILNNDFPAMAASAKSVAFGNWAACILLDTTIDVAFSRFAEESAYAAANMTGFLAQAYAAFSILDQQAIKFYQNAAS